MKELIAFFKEIFMMNENSGMKVGLSQFKTAPVEKTPVKKVQKQELRLSDLMRKSA